MSHEIRTPMNAVIGLTGIALADADEPDRVSAYLHKIENSYRLLLSILNDVLVMSAIEGGKLKINREPFDFCKLLTNITAVFFEQARQRGVCLTVQMQGIPEEKMVGDELRVNQILMNLLSNAVKFTPAGGRVVLSILQDGRSPQKVALRFRVADTGC